MPVFAKIRGVDGESSVSAPDSFNFDSNRAKEAHELREHSLLTYGRVGSSGDGADGAQPLRENPAATSDSGDAAGDASGLIGVALLDDGGLF